VQGAATQTRIAVYGLRPRMAVSLYTSAPKGPQYKLYQRIAGCSAAHVRAWRDAMQRSSGRAKRNENRRHV